MVILKGKTFKSLLLKYVSLQMKIVLKRGLGITILFIENKFKSILRKIALHNGKYSDECLSISKYNDLRLWISNQKQRRPHTHAICSSHEEESLLPELKLLGCLPIRIFVELWVVALS